MGSRTEWHGAHWVADIKCSLLGFSYTGIGFQFLGCLGGTQIDFFFRPDCRLKKENFYDLKSVRPKPPSYPENWKAYQMIGKIWVETESYTRPMAAQHRPRKTKHFVTTWKTKKCYAAPRVPLAAPSSMRSTRSALTAPPSSAMSATTAAADR